MDPLKGLFPDRSDSHSTDIVSVPEPPSITMTHTASTSVGDVDPSPGNAHSQPRAPSEMSFMQYLSRAMHVNATLPVPTTVAVPTQNTGAKSENYDAAAEAKCAKKKEVVPVKQSTRATAKYVWQLLSSSTPLLTKDFSQESLSNRLVPGPHRRLKRTV
jgi:hypothetical protein